MRSLVRRFLRLQHGMSALQTVLIVALAALMVAGIWSLWRSVISPRLDATIQWILQQDGPDGN